MSRATKEKERMVRRDDAKKPAHGRGTILICRRVIEDGAEVHPVQAVENEPTKLIFCCPSDDCWKDGHVMSSCVRCVMDALGSRFAAIKDAIEISATANNKFIPRGASA